MSKAHDGELWKDHPNPMVAAAERRLYVAGAKALRATFLDICRLCGMPERVMRERAESDRIPK